jgi:hypothetical protein
MVWGVQLQARSLYREIDLPILLWNGELNGHYGGSDSQWFWIVVQKLERVKVTIEQIGA